ncbi:hypothetical protein GCM10022626_13940 [[Pseudomonas] carboxydohydrogena]
MVSERTKQLTDAVAMARAARVTRRAVGNGHAQRRSRIGEMRELRVLAQAGEHAAPCVGDDELERTITGAVSEQSAGRAGAVLEHIVLQFTDRAHEAGHQTPWQACGDASVFGMFDPLVPEGVVSAGRQIETAERKDTSPIMRAGAADRAIAQRAFDLMEDRRLYRHAAISVGRRQVSDGKLDQRANKAGSSEGQRRQLRQAAGHGLPQQVVGRLKSRIDAALLPLAQGCSRLPRSNRPVDSSLYSINESRGFRRAFGRATSKALGISTASPMLEGNSLAS